MVKVHPLKDVQPLVPERATQELVNVGIDIQHSLERLCGTPGEFKLNGDTFFVVAEDAWIDAAPDVVQRELRLRAVGHLQIKGRNHVILCAHARANDMRETQSLTCMLTHRELQIATMVADGCSDKTIARRLSISEYTVREHVRRMFHKAKVSKRAALASLVSRLQRKLTDEG